MLVLHSSCIAIWATEQWNCAQQYAYVLPHAYQLDVNTSGPTLMSSTLGFMPSKICITFRTPMVKSNHQHRPGTLSCFQIKMQVQYRQTSSWPNCFDLFLLLPWSKCFSHLQMTTSRIHRHGCITMNRWGTWQM